MDSLLSKAQDFLYATQGIARPQGGVNFLSPRTRRVLLPFRLPGPSTQVSSRTFAPTPVGRPSKFYPLVLPRLPRYPFPRRENEILPTCRLRPFPNSAISGGLNHSVLSADSEISFAILITSLSFSVVVAADGGNSFRADFIPPLLLVTIFGGGGIFVALPPLFLPVLLFFFVARGSFRNVSQCLRSKWNACAARLRFRFRWGRFSSVNLPKGRPRLKKKQEAGFFLWPP